MIDPGSLVGEPLVTDRRLEKIERQLRKEYPLLPEGCEFVTFHQPHTYATQNGIVQPIPDVAVFGIRVPNPKDPGRPRLLARHTSLSAWRSWEREARHNGEIQADPLYLIYKVNKDGMTLPQRAIDWWTNMRDLLPAKTH